MTAHSFTLCVYCGSRMGSNQAYEREAAALGTAIGERGWRLVYGGGNVGLMGVVADAAMAAGSHVAGVIPESLLRREVGHRGLSELLVVQTMHQRKQAMAERASAFVALPGGIGTLEELFEVWTWRQLGYHASPIGLLDVAGYYEALLLFLQHSVDQGFLDAAQLGSIIVERDVQRLLDRVAAVAAGGHETDLRRI